MEDSLWQMDLSNEALRNGDLRRAQEILFGAVTPLASVTEDPDSEVLFVSSAIDLSNLSFALGKDYPEVTQLLLRAKKVAERLGDKRSEALIDLHLGRLFYVAGRRAEAMRAFETGKVAVSALGDDDILSQAAEFIGMYFWGKGMFREALKHLETANQLYESQGGTRLKNASAPIFFSLALAFSAQFDRAIGCLDHNWRQARIGFDSPIAFTFRSLLGTILLVVDKRREAFHHLKGAWNEGKAADNAFARYLAAAGLAYYHFLEDRFEEAKEMIGDMVEQADTVGIGHRIVFPWMIEMLCEFERLGSDTNPEYNYQRQMEEIKQDASLHMRGIAMRLEAETALSGGEDTGQIKKKLSDSESMLRLAGDPIQLAKTQVAIALLNIREGRTKDARDIAQEARRVLSGRWEKYYPDSLRSLTEPIDAQTIEANPPEGILKAFLESLEEFTPSSCLESSLGELVSRLNRFLGAERGGLFWSESGNPMNQRLMASCNLSEDAVDHSKIKSAIFDSFRKNKPLIWRRRGSGKGGVTPGILASICLPVTFEGRVRGVLYHDNSYVDNCFEHLTESLQVWLSEHVSAHVMRIFEYDKLLTETKRITIDKTLQVAHESAGGGILVQTPAMSQIVAQAEIVARSDCSVLIQGETGVGKELMARQIHEMSLRKDEPFVAVDLNTIPETLTESELFGHEKGAFTGADGRKTGRVELAHTGTLFIDEIGEIPKSTQVKLLRVLQEKTFQRVGGRSLLTSDFRLIAASNRDLAAEMTAGRFRDDLYYRINIVPLTIPPLRERREDIIPLASSFLSEYAGKYGRQDLRLTPEDEARLCDYPWPGNVRELRNVMERSVILSRGEQLELSFSTVTQASLPHPFADYPSLDEVQRRYIKFVLEKTGGRISGPMGAAEILGMKRTSLNTRMKNLGVSRNSIFNARG